MSSAIISSFAFRFSLALGLSTTLGSAALAQSSCKVVFNGASTAQATAHAWRLRTTNLTKNGEAVPTSTAREAWLKSAQTAMEKFMTDEIDTPEMVFAVAEGITSVAPRVAVDNKLANTIPLNYTTNAADQGFHYDVVPRIKVSGLGPSGMLMGTLLLPVSGHTGLADAKKWSKTDTYTIYLEDSRGKKTALVTNARSLDYTTSQEIKAQLKVGEIAKLTYYRSGSGGPAGYSDGRVIEIEWDGN
jgi:hypothetical protein